MTRRRSPVDPKVLSGQLAALAGSRAAIRADRLQRQRSAPTFEERRRAVDETIGNPDLDEPLYAGTAPGRANTSGKLPEVSAAAIRAAQPEHERTLGAPTFHERRRAVDDTIDHHDLGQPVYGAMGDAIRVLWNRADFRPETEARRVEGIVDAIAIPALDRMEAELLAAVLEIVDAIATEMPGLPRALAAVPDPDPDPSGPAVAAAAVPPPLRDKVEYAWRTPRPNSGVHTAAGTFSDAFSGITAAVDAIWAVDELRASELDRLDALAGEAIPPIRREAERQLLEAVTAAAEQFAAEFPNAPLRKAA